MSEYNKINEDLNVLMIKENVVQSKLLETADSIQKLEKNMPNIMVAIFN